MKISRRSLLAGSALGVASAAGGAIVGREWLADQAGPVESQAAPPTVKGGQTAVLSGAVPFRGANQAGIATPPQRHAVFAAFDVNQRDHTAVADLLTSWTAIAETLTAGGTVDSDSGEATGLGPARLTVTFGFSAAFFDDQCAPSASRPARLVDLPSFAGDALEQAWGGGDVIVQVCADDPTVASHAVRQLRRVGAGTMALRWMQNGFLPTVPGKTPRNLFGQVDGTANPTGGSDAFGKLVWARKGDGPAWMTGGTCMGVRRIRMGLTMWDRMGSDVHDATIGRSRATGAPLTGGDEFAPVDLTATNPDGSPVIASDAHVRVAKQAGPGMLRRGYSFDNGPRTVTNAAVDATATGSTGMMDHAAHSQMGHAGMAAMMDDHDAGLMFVAFVADPRSQFLAVQQALSAGDALGHFLSYTSASLWAIPGGRKDASIAAGIYE